MDSKSLFKRLSNNKTSEQAFGIGPQPANTCPMIDSTLANVRSFRGRLGTLEQQLSDVLDRPVYECHRDDYISFSLQVESLIDQLSEWNRAYQFLEVELENLRNYLSAIRESTNRYKQSIWMDLDYSITVDEAEMTFSKNMSGWARSLFPVLKTDNSNIDGAIESINALERLYYDNSPTSCPTCQLPQIKEEVESLVFGIDPNILSEQTLDECLNKTYLEEWIDEVKGVSSKDVGEELILLLQSHGFEKKD